MKNMVGHSKPWLITAAICLVTMGQTVMLYAVSAFLTIMVSEVGMNGVQQGVFTGIQNLSNMIFLLFGVVIAIKLGTKINYGVGSLLTILSGIFFFIGTYQALLVARVIMGIANGMTIPMVASILNQIFGTNKKAATFATGIYGSSFYLARYIALSIAYPILSVVGTWQRTFLVLTLVGLLGSIIWFVIYPDAEEFQGRNKNTSSLSETVNAWKAGWRNSTVRKFALYYSLNGFSGTAFNTFAIPLIVYRYGFEAGTASGAFAYSGLAGLAGSLIGGFIASRSRVKDVTVPAQFLSGTCMILIALLNHPSIEFLCFICSVLGFCNGLDSCNNISLMYKQKNMSMQEILGGVSLVMLLFKVSCYLSNQIFCVVYPIIGIDKAILIWAISEFAGGIAVCTIAEPKISEM